MTPRHDKYVLRQRLTDEQRAALQAATGVNASHVSALREYPMSIELTGTGKALVRFTWVGLVDAEPLRCLHDTQRPVFTEPAVSRDAAGGAGTIRGLLRRLLHPSG